MLGIRPEQTPKPQQSWIGPAPCLETALPGPNARAVIEADERVSSPSYTRDFPLAVRRALGSVVEDVDGNRFLDLCAGIAVCSTGHCHPQVVEAVTAQANSLLHICGSDFYYPSMAELMEKLTRIVPGDAPKRVFLSNSGTEAVEAAIKLARFSTRRKYLIAFHGAFHGRTMGSLSLTSSKRRHREGFGPFIPGVFHANYEDIDGIENQLFKLQVSPSEVAAIFVEAVQGESGYRVASHEFLQKLRELCNHHGILLVCDEIQSGMGRTGKWFAFEHAGIQPDIVVMAKGIASGLPLGATVANEKLMNWPAGAHASTFGGNPVACAAASATIDVIEQGYLANAAKLGPYLLNGLKALESQHKPLAGARGLGLMAAVDVVHSRTGTPDPQRRMRVVRQSFERGILLLPCGESAVRFCPPLCINQAQLELGLKLFSDAVAASK